MCVIAVCSRRLDNMYINRFHLSDDGRWVLHSCVIGTSALISAGFTSKGPCWLSRQQLPVTLGGTAGLFCTAASFFPSTGVSGFRSRILTNTQCSGFPVITNLMAVKWLLNVALTCVSLTMVMMELLTACGVLWFTERECGPVSVCGGERTTSSVALPPRTWSSDWLATECLDPPLPPWCWDYRHLLLCSTFTRLQQLNLGLYACRANTHRAISPAQRWPVL